jgi:hypothetical protein
MAARSPIARWACRHGLLADARSLDEISAHLLYQPDTELPERLTRFLRSFDRIVSFLGTPDDPVTERLQTVCPGEVIAIDPRPKESTTRDGLHITRQWAADLGRCGHPVSTDIENRAVLTDHERRACRTSLVARLGAETARVALCHPGSGGLDKCCPIEAWERVVAKLAANRWTLGWLIGPDEVERFGPDYARRLERSAPVMYEESVEQAADWVCGADAYLGHDAGMTHLAAYLGIRTVAIFGPTDPRVWQPLGPRCRIAAFPESDRPIDDWVDSIVSLVGSIPPVS